MKVVRPPLGDIHRENSDHFVVLGSSPENDRRYEEAKGNWYLLVDPENNFDLELLRGMVSRSGIVSTNGDMKGRMRRFIDKEVHPPKEVYEHLVVNLNEPSMSIDGNVRSVCGKVWAPNQPNIKVIGKCSDCLQQAQGWTA